MRLLRNRVTVDSFRPLLVVLILAGVWLARERQVVLERRAVREKLDRTISATAPPPHADWLLARAPTASRGLAASLRELLGDQPLAQIRFPRLMSRAELEYVGKWFPEAMIQVAREPTRRWGPPDGWQRPHHGSRAG
jgi:hypothetical protein